MVATIAKKTTNKIQMEVFAGIMNSEAKSPKANAKFSAVNFCQFFCSFIITDGAPSRVSFLSLDLQFSGMIALR